jgi:hypothetical protein
MNSFVDSHIAFAEVILAQSASMRHQDRVFREEVVPALSTYDEQVEVARSLTCLAQRRGYRFFSTVDVMLSAATFAGPGSRKLSPEAASELEHLRHMLQHASLRFDGKDFNLKDIGWSSAWRDPHPNCIAFRNSIQAIENLTRTLSISELWEYGLVPSDLEEFDMEIMKQANYWTDVTDALLAKHGGDWRAMLRDDSIVGQPLC